MLINLEALSLSPMDTRNALHKQHALRIKKIILSRRKRYLTDLKKRKQAELIATLRLNSLSHSRNIESSCKTNVHRFFHDWCLDKATCKQQAFRLSN